METFFANRPDPARFVRSLDAASALGPAAGRNLRALLARCPAYRPTPVLALHGIASDLGLAAVAAKDERARFGLGSFKALGGAYAVFTLAAQRVSHARGHEVTVADLLETAERPAVGLTVATATAGNHGRSVAAGAALVGARCVVFVYRGVPPDQIAAIARHGAEIRHVDGVYEDAVRACRERAEAEGWQVVSDTSWEGYEDIPLQVMAGYTAMVSEAVQQTRTRPPTHVFVQAGVGGMAAAVAGYLAQGAVRVPPRIVVVEPTAAACLLESARRGAPTTVPATARTAMGRLECYRPSPVAWKVLDGLADAFMAIPDACAFEAQQRLAHAGIDTTASGAAGLAGLIEAARSPRTRAALRLDDCSRALVFVTEAATEDAARPGPSCPHTEAREHV